MVVAATPAQYWATFDPDYQVDSLSRAIMWAGQVRARVQSWHPTAAFRIVYRGHRNSEHAMSSTLYRALGSPTETQLTDDERGRLLPDLRRWQLHLHSAGLLPAVPLLATLQHLGGRTRLVDVTHSVAVALWFAVERKEVADDDSDARLFAMTYSSDLSTSGKWESLQWKEQPFWWDWPQVLGDVVVWTPPPVEHRMSRQQAAFLISRVPASLPLQLRQLPNGNVVRAADWRVITSLPKRAHVLSTAGRPPSTEEVLFTVRVPAARKAAIRLELDQALGISERSMYPDLPGYVEYHK